MIKEAKNIQEKPVKPVVTEKIIQQEDTIDLLELFWVLVNRWKIILLTMLITAMLAGVYYLVGVKPSYQADASIFITNNESVITVSDLQLSSELTEDYAKIIKSRNVLKQVIKELDLDLDYRGLSKLVSVTNPDNSHIITITVNGNVAHFVFGENNLYQLPGFQIITSQTGKVFCYDGCHVPSFNLM